MSLMKMPNELLCMVAECLHLRDHSSFTLVSRHFVAVLQHSLRSRLRTLPLHHARYALLALFWSIVSKDYDQLKFLLENTTGISAIGGAGVLHTSPGVCDGDNWERIRLQGHRLVLRGPNNRIWLGINGSCAAAEFAILRSHHGLRRLALAQETKHAYALATLRSTALEGSLTSLKTALLAFRATFGRSAWKHAQNDTLKTIAQTGDHLLFQDGAFPQDSAGRTILHRAIIGSVNLPDDPAGSLSRPELVWVLLLAGVNLNVRDNAGKTALHFAAAAVYEDVVKLLLRGGASMDLLDKEGCSPVHVALRVENEQKRRTLVALMQEYGAGRGVAKKKKVVVARGLIDYPMKLRSSVRRSAK